MSRTKKKPYSKSKRFDKSCRNNGTCAYCYNNRMHKVLKKIYPIEPEIKAFEDRYDELPDDVYDIADYTGLKKIDREELDRLRNTAYEYFKLT